MLPLPLLVAGPGMRPSGQELGRLRGTWSESLERQQHVDCHILWAVGPPIISNGRDTGIG